MGDNDHSTNETVRCGKTTIRALWVITVRTLYILLDKTYLVASSAQFDVLLIALCLLCYSRCSFLLQPMRIMSSCHEITRLTNYSIYSACHSVIAATLLRQFLFFVSPLRPLNLLFCYVMTHESAATPAHVIGPPRCNLFHSIIRNFVARPSSGRN